SKADPESAAKLVQLKALGSSYQQRDFVMNNGWATVPSADSPSRELAQACAEMLLKPAQT
ncbi:MAG: hypothetical protein ACREEE_15660, partial [Dongiaceae bacterium]